MRTAAQTLQISHDARLLLYRLFDRHVMAKYARVSGEIMAILSAFSPLVEPA